MNASALIDSSAPVAATFPGNRIFGEGEVATLIRSLDWEGSALGPVSTWPETLVTMVNTVLSTPMPTSIYWGPQQVLLYNDAYRSFMGLRHPLSLGQPGSEVWKEAWHIVGPQIEKTFCTGEMFHGRDTLVPIEENGLLTDHYWNYSFSPIYEAPSGRIVGVHNVSVNTTESFLMGRECVQLGERLSQVLESTNDGVVSFDRDWRITYMNERARRLHGPLNFTVGRVLWDVLPELVEGTPDFYHLHRAMDHHEPGEFESFYPKPLNHVLRVQVRPAADGIVVFLSDITERERSARALKKAAEDLASSEEELRWIIGLSSQLPWIADAEGHILKNRGDVTTLTGHAVEDVLGDDWTRMMPSNDAARLQEVWADCVRTGKLYDIEHRVVTKGGELRWFRSRAFPRRNAEGQIVKWYGITDDIDEQKRRADTLEQTAAALAASEEELRWTVHLSAQVPWTACPDGHLLTISDRWYEMTGLAHEPVLGAGWIAVQHPDDVGDVMNAWAHCVKTGEPLDIEHRLRLVSGDYCWIRSQAFARRDEQGDIVRWYGTTEDIQARKLAEEGLRTSEKLAAVGRLATSIAHEINNPLEAVTNLLYLARNSNELPEVLSYIKSAEQELHRASVITNQTLRFQRQSSAPIPLDSEDLIDNCLAVFQGKLQNSSVTPEKRLRAARPVTCYDGEIRQVFLNLVGNAIDAMHATGGRLLIRTREARHPADGKHGLVLTVADTGYGIPPEVRKRLFEPFFTTKGIGGTGLGLWVTKDIVARHRGVLRVRSKPARRKTDLDPEGKAHGGTVFTLFLPFDAAVRHAPPVLLSSGQHDAVTA